MEIQGHFESQFKPVKDLYEDLYKQERELGSSFSVYKNGRPLVDLWAGYADKEKLKSWKQDSLATVWSTTKGVAALTCALAVERELLDYNKKVSYYWPEFGCKGKEDITVAMLLSHQAGICGPQTKKIEDFFNQELMASKLADMSPIWKPGTSSGYHSMTFGWLTSELIKRTTGETLGNFYRNEIGKPNDIDFYIGLPEKEDHRAVEMIPFGREKNKEAAKKKPTEAQIASNVGPNLLKGQNTRAWREAEIPSANGQGSASGLAKLYSLVVPSDSSLNILREDTIRKMTQPQIEGKDLVLDVETRWASGLVLNKRKFIYGPIEDSFGHSGFGGSCAFADPQNNLGISYVMNKMENNFNSDGRSVELIHAIYKCLEK